MRTVANILFPLLEKIYFDPLMELPGVPTNIVLNRNSLYMRIDEDRRIAYIHFNGEESPSLSTNVCESDFARLDLTEYDLIVRPTSKNGHRAVAFSEPEDEDMELVIMSTTLFTDGGQLIPNKRSHPYRKEDIDIVEKLTSRLDDASLNKKQREATFSFLQAICTQAHANGSISNQNFHRFYTGEYIHGDFRALSYSHHAVTMLNHHIEAMGYKRMSLNSTNNPWFLVDGKHPMSWYPLSLSRIPTEKQMGLIHKHLGPLLKAKVKK